MNQEAQRQAMAFGRYLIQKLTGVDLGVTANEQTWQSWTARLYPAERSRFRSLRSAWTLTGEPGYVPLTTITLKAERENSAWVLNPGERDALFEQHAKALGQAFIDHAGQTESNFERFYYLMQKYTSTLPCTYGEEGVSLFRQWTMVTALMAIADEGKPDKLPSSLALIGLDLPGIQETVYTITARGAAKGVRGRSAFIQLLVNAVVDRLLDTLHLCRANILVNAGGGALILAGWQDQLKATLQQINYEINSVLFNGDNYRPDLHFAGFKGDLALALACTEISYTALTYPIIMQLDPVTDQIMSPWQLAERELKELIGAAKQQPFLDLISDEGGFATLFRPDPAYSEAFCAICRRPEEGIDRFEADPDRSLNIDNPSGVICPECKGFEALANRLAKSNALLNRFPKDAIGFSDPTGWQAALHAISGYWYRIDTVADARATTLTFNPDTFPATHIDGYWPLATSTPLTAEGTILDNSTLAENTTSTLERLGVLKADVDNLASILAISLPQRSAALTAILSESLTLFFGGWLEQLCQEPLFRNKLYVLYAGGDDLLIIGSWDVIPLVARRIAADFQHYTGNNPTVHLSAGITLVGGKEPLYAAVNAADEALDQAKVYRKGESNAKNAITFLGQTCSWSEFDRVIDWQQRLVKLRRQGAPAALVTRLSTIYQQYRKDRGWVKGIPPRAQIGEYNGVTLYLGPWMWKLAYGLSRMASGQPYREEIETMQVQLIQPGEIERMGVGARWAQFITREKTE